MRPASFFDTGRNLILLTDLRLTCVDNRLVEIFVHFDIGLEVTAHDSSEAFRVILWHIHHKGFELGLHVSINGCTDNDRSIRDQRGLPDFIEVFHINQAISSKPV